VFFLSLSLSAWVMFVFGSAVLYGGLAYSLYRAYRALRRKR